MLHQLYYLRKLQRHLGLKDAIKVYAGLKVKKTGIIKVGFLKYPFRIRTNSAADSAVFNEVILRKEYDLQLNFTPQTIIDGGANIGLTSIFFANKFPQADIIAVEPDSANFHLLQENVAHYPHIKPMQSALWSRKAKLKVTDPGRGEHSYTVEETNEDAASFTGIGISDMMQQHSWKKIDILKLDVEGSEKELFAKNYEEWLPNTRVLIVETHDRFVKGSSRPVFAAIAKYNFSCRIMGFNLVFFNEEL